MNLAEKIKELRVDREWTQTQLAIKAGLGQEGRNYINALENGRISRPSAEKLVKIAKAFDVDDDVLFEAAGIKKVSKPNTEVDNFYIWLKGKEPSKRDLKKIMELAEVLLRENE